jgi:hypothetical protein
LIPAGTGSFYHLNRRKAAEPALGGGFGDVSVGGAASADFGSERPDEAEAPAG